MIGFLKEFFVGMALLAGITFFGVLIWATVYSIVKTYKDEQRKR